jgi:hypothetical protein
MAKNRRGKMTKCDYQSIDIEVTIDIDDVCEFIEDYATSSDVKSIQAALRSAYDEVPSPNRTLIDDMKTRLFIKAHQKYTLEELEERLEMTYI